MARPKNNHDEMLNIGRGTAVAPTVKRNSVGAIVGQIKSISAKRINKLRQSPYQPVWQRNYYDNIIKNDEIYLKVLDYIDTNPLKWNEDKYNEINCRGDAGGSPEIKQKITDKERKNKC